MKDLTAVFNHSGTYPNVVSVNVTVPGDGTGTEWIKAYVDDDWGFAQHLLDKAGYADFDDVAESSTASQKYEALRRCFGPPGELVGWYGQVDPDSVDIRLLICEGQTVTITDYQDLVDNTYVGDGNNGNPLYFGFRKFSDNPGTVADTAGPYFKLPDLRGKFLRGYDPTNVTDPDVRLFPSFQTDAFKVHGHELTGFSSGNYCESDAHTTGGVTGWGQNASKTVNRLIAANNIADIVGGGADFDETRAYNVNVKWCVRF